MRKFLFLVLLLGTATLFSQEEKVDSFIDANYFYGTILRHNKDIAHLIKGHPDGLILSYNKKTFGEERWQQAYNYPDWGVSFVYHNPQYDILGANYGVYAHYNSYFFNRNVLLRIGQGIAYASNKFDLESNPKNNAYGSSLLSSTYLMLNYNKQYLFKNIGIQAGLAVIHYSNANVTAPNSSTNSLTFNVGLQYHLDREETSEYSFKEYTKFSEPIKFNLMLRTGVNESDYLNLGQEPFLVVSTFLDKRLSYKSSIQIGADMFFSYFLKRQIEYISISFPSYGIKGDEDYKRAGVFAGHELHIGKVGVLTQLGYYVYYPYDFEGRTYFRAGLTYRLHKNIVASTTLKSHGAKAEAVEFGIGIRI
ncbi:acyloxyacyl hydrolase [Cochleicola gelatinilyticus]|uniref:Deacylase n=1 Tax=Cochleicola gelatinilyticus TaxID=1763537 RepID=A0A167EZ80_9FLAO|nr:acyloxyacyl hydrolase [Cochleicola gelatinilyticus]OAB76030.1 deacylase [Cochleicola gelatinilyticus]